MTMIYHIPPIQNNKRNMKSIEIGNNTLKTRSPRVTLLTLETIS